MVRDDKGKGKLNDHKGKGKRIMKGLGTLSDQLPTCLPYLEKGVELVASSATFSIWAIWKRRNKMINASSDEADKLEMDPHTSLGRMFINENQNVTLNDMIESEGEWSGFDYLDTTDNGKKKETKAYTFYRMESEEVRERFKVQEKEVKRLAIWPETITCDSDEDELDALLASINIDELPPIDITNFPPFVCNTGKGLRNKKKPTKTYKITYDGEGHSLTVNRPKTQEELAREELEEDLYEKIMLLNEKRPIIETLKYGDKHKMLLDSFLLDKLKLDGEFELEEEIVGEQVIREYKDIKEKEDHGCFVLPIRLEGKLDFHALVDTVLNLLGLLDVLCGVIMRETSFLGSSIEIPVSSMSSSAVSIPYSSGKSIGSSTSLIILSDYETEMIVVSAVVPAIIPEISPEAEAAVVASPVGVLDLAIHPDFESEPFEAPPSLVHRDVVDPESDPSMAESEEDPLEDDPSEAVEPQPTQAISSPPV
ncbi:hypothetical protein Tco_0162358 [Tanacetum coccineum]